LDVFVHVVLEIILIVLHAVHIRDVVIEVVLHSVHVVDPVYVGV
jgi:hypothetical protein